MSDKTLQDQQVIVGVDGSEGSRAALRWACNYATRLGSVVPLTMFLPGPFVEGFGTSGGNDPNAEPYRQAALDMLIDVVRAVDPALVDVAQALEHRPGPGLIKASAGARLLVVGSRGSSDRLDVSVGSVGSYCARHSRVPVALIPPHATAAAQPTVICGVDGSDGSQRALRWALQHVQPPGKLIAISVIADESITGEPLFAPPQSAATSARADLERVVAEARSMVEECLDVEIVVVAGDPRSALRAASADADLIVIGARGHGIIEHLLLGSVATALAHYPVVPTIVVPRPS